MEPHICLVSQNWEEVKTIWYLECKFVVINDWSTRTKHGYPAGPLVTVPHCVNYAPPSRLSTHIQGPFFSSSFSLISYPLFSPLFHFSLIPSLPSPLGLSHKHLPHLHFPSLIPYLSSMFTHFCHPAFSLLQFLSQISFLNVFFPFLSPKI